jgi:urease accessory protein
MPTIYLQSSAGGLFEHDRLHLEIVGEPGAQAHVTTSASTIVHSMAAGHAEQSVQLRAEAGALVEYIPDLTILFPAARLKSILDVSVGDRAHVLLADAFLTHDYGGAGLVFDWFMSEIVIRNGASAVLARDRFRALGEAVQSGAPGVTDRFCAQGSVLALCPADEVDGLLCVLRERVLECPGTYAGASALPNGAGVLVRILADDAVALREAVFRAWAGAREHWTGNMPVPRRK